jgi:CRISPR-associated protein Cas2
MWVIVLFDLPVVTAEQWRVAGRFRIYLKSLGFDRVQYSVYMRDGGTPVQTEAITQRVIKGLPEVGHVYVIYLTDRQYGLIRRFVHQVPKGAFERPEQFVLF